MSPLPRRCGRSPYGERGLKYLTTRSSFAENRSLSLRRAWIEILFDFDDWRLIMSLSLRRAWIEIELSDGRAMRRLVALLTESVD